MNEEVTLRIAWGHMSTRSFLNPPDGVDIGSGGVHNWHLFMKQACKNGYGGGSIEIERKTLNHFEKTTITSKQIVLGLLDELEYDLYPISNAKNFKAREMFSDYYESRITLFP